MKILAGAVALVQPIIMMIIRFFPSCGEYLGTFSTSILIVNHSYFIFCREIHEKYTQAMRLYTRTFKSPTRLLGPRRWIWRLFLSRTLQSEIIFSNVYSGFVTSRKMYMTDHLRQSALLFQIRK